METLSPGEKTILKRVYQFAQDHSFKYGINQKFLPSSYKQYVQPLFNKQLIFYRKKYGNTYWLPTKQGRAVIESKAQNSSMSACHEQDNLDRDEVASRRMR